LTGPRVEGAGRRGDGEFEAENRTNTAEAARRVEFDGADEGVGVGEGEGGLTGRGGGRDELRGRGQTFEQGVTGVNVEVNEGRGQGVYSDRQQRPEMASIVSGRLVVVFNASLSHNAYNVSVYGGPGNGPRPSVKSVAGAPRETA